MTDNELWPERVRELVAQGHSPIDAADLAELEDEAEDRAAEVERVRVRAESDGEPVDAAGLTRSDYAAMGDHEYDHQPDGMEDERIAARDWPIAQLGARAIHLGYDDHDRAAERVALTEQHVHRCSPDRERRAAWLRQEGFSLFRNRAEIWREERAIALHVRAFTDRTLAGVAAGVAAGHGL